MTIPPADRTRARTLLRQAFAEAIAIQDEETRRTALYAVGRSFADADDDAGTLQVALRLPKMDEVRFGLVSHVVDRALARRAFDEALRIARTYGSNPYEVLDARFAAGDTDGALAGLRGLPVPADQGISPYHELLAKVSGRKRRAGQKSLADSLLTRAQAPLAAMEFQNDRDEALAKLAEALAKGGDRVGALGRVAPIDDLQRRRYALRSVASALAESGFPEEAERTAERCAEADDRYQALGYAAAARWKQKDLAGAARRIAQVLARRGLSSDTLGAIAIRLREVGADAEADRVFDTIPEPRERVDAALRFVEIAQERRRTPAARASLIRAAEAANQVSTTAEEPDRRASAQILVAIVARRVGERALALDLLDRALADARTYQGSERRSPSQVMDIVAAYAGWDDLDRLRRTAALLTRVTERADAQVLLAQAFLTRGDRAAGIAAAHEALRLARTAPPESLHTSVDQALAMDTLRHALLLAWAGDIPGALAAAATIPATKPYERDDAYADIAAWQARNGDASGATATLQQVRMPQARLGAYTEVATLLVRRGDRAGADRLLSESHTPPLRLAVRMGIADALLHPKPLPDRPERFLLERG